MPAPLRRLLAVVVREIRDLTRRRAPFVLRTLYGAALGLIVFAVLIGSMSGSRSALGSYVGWVTSQTFEFITVLQSFVLLILGTLLAINSVMAEKSNRTLGLLALSRIRSLDLILGKAIALLGIVAMVVIVAVPVFGILGWAGGLDYLWLGKFAILSLVAALLGISIGLFCGLALRGGAAATLWSMVIAFGIVILPGWSPSPGIAALIDHTWIWSAIMTVGSQGVRSEIFATPIAFNVGLACVFLVGAAAILGPAASRGPGRGLKGTFERLDALFERLNPRGAHIGPLRPKDVSRGNPVAWLSRATGGYGIGRYALRVSLAVVCLFFILITAAVAGMVWARVLIWILLPSLLLVPLAVGANAFAGERSRQSLLLLLSTPLTGRRIVAGKTAAAVQLLTVVIGPVLVVSILAAMLLGSLGFALVGFVISLLLVTAEGVCAFFLALGMSVFLSHAMRAGAAALGLLVLVNLAPSALVSIVYAAAIEGQRWAWITLGVLTLVFVVLVIAYVVYLNRKAIWGFLGVLSIAILGGTVIGLMWLPSIAYGFDRGSPDVAFAVMTAYLIAISGLCYRFLSHSLDWAMGRAQ
jgi:ABC-type transport system involved in multi-copper enzyme maturation permease subunit